MSGTNGTVVFPANEDALGLRRAEAIANSCVDCGTQDSRSWIYAGDNRVRCAECHERERQAPGGAS